MGAPIATSPIYMNAIDELFQQTILSFLPVFNSVDMDEISLGNCPSQSYNQGCSGESFKEIMTRYRQTLRITKYSSSGSA